MAATSSQPPFPPPPHTSPDVYSDSQLITILHDHFKGRTTPAGINTHGFNPFLEDPVDFIRRFKPVVGRDGKKEWYSVTQLQPVNKKALKRKVRTNEWGEWRDQGKVECVVVENQEMGYRKYYSFKRFNEGGNKDKTTTGWSLHQFHLKDVGEEGPVLCKVHASRKVAPRPSPAMGNEVLPEGVADEVRRNSAQLAEMAAKFEAMQKEFAVREEARETEVAAREAKRQAVLEAQVTARVDREVAERLAPIQKELEDRLMEVAKREMELARSEKTAGIILACLEKEEKNKKKLEKKKKREWRKKWEWKKKREEEEEKKRDGRKKPGHTSPPSTPMPLSTPAAGQPTAVTPAAGEATSVSSAAGQVAAVSSAVAVSSAAGQAVAVSPAAGQAAAVNLAVMQVRSASATGQATAVMSPAAAEATAVNLVVRQATAVSPAPAAGRAADSHPIDFFDLSASQEAPEGRTLQLDAAAPSRAYLDPEASQTGFNGGLNTDPTGSNGGLNIDFFDLSEWQDSEGRTMVPYLQLEAAAPSRAYSDPDARQTGSNGGLNTDPTGSNGGLNIDPNTTSVDVDVDVELGLNTRAASSEGPCYITWTLNDCAFDHLT